MTNLGNFRGGSNIMQNICQNYALMAIIYVIDKVMSLIQLIGPILACVALAVNFIKLMTNPEEKKYMKNLKNSIIALVMLFFIPVITNASVNLIFTDYSLEDCFSIAREEKDILNGANYTDIPLDTKEPTSIIANPSDYEQGDENKVVVNGDFLGSAKKIWRKVVNGNFKYDSSKRNYIPITGNKIDCSGYVSWVLYEYGLKDQFGGKQFKTKNFMEYDWKALGATVISVKAGENVVSKLQPGDILVRAPIKNGEVGYGHVNITASKKNGQIYAYDCGSESNWKNSGGDPINMTWFAKDKRPGKIIRFSD